MVAPRTEEKEDAMKEDEAKQLSAEMVVRADETGVLDEICRIHRIKKSDYVVMLRESVYQALRKNFRELERFRVA